MKPANEASPTIYPSTTQSSAPPTRGGPRRRCRRRERDIGAPSAARTRHWCALWTSRGKGSFSDIDFGPELDAKTAAKPADKERPIFGKRDDKKCAKMTLKNRHDFRRPVAPNPMFCYCLAQAGFRPWPSHFPTTM